jgi:glycyl-tRNA synthetase beta chain
MTARDFLLEIGCEELPAQGLSAFAEKIANELIAALKNAQLDHKEVNHFVTPRRLAVQIKQLSALQPNRQVEKRGPALTAPEKAKLGFLHANKISAEDVAEENGYWVYRYQEKGQATKELLPLLVQQSIAKLSGMKWMRWGNHVSTFLRPVHWVVMLFGEELIQSELLGIKTQRETVGHRFHQPMKLLLQNASDYEDILLEEGFVRVDFAKRRTLIRQQIEKLAAEQESIASIDADLLDEVTGLVEWPVALLCQFPAAFLKVPKEALISSMQQHQKSFPLLDHDGNLRPYFITISNIQSQDPKKVILGNERVMRARLSDAAFFYEQDLKTLLSSRRELLEKITFQQQLGSMADKVRRIITLAKQIASVIHADQKKVAQAARLSKCDLTTQMVGEFPELQGIMGGYYAQLQGEDEEIAMAIREHYLPKFAGDSLPKTAIGCAIALADRIDTLVGIFSIKQAPTGDKDPFGLRRAANGVIRIIIEKELAGINLTGLLPAEVQQFILDRLPAYYQEQSITSDVIQAVLEVQPDNLFDAHRRIIAVEAFRQLAEAAALSEANKRVKNILRKQDQSLQTLTEIDVSLFEHAAEKNLFAALTTPYANDDYQALLKKLSLLKKPIDAFFDHVMVDVDNQKIKANRLALLKKLRELFLQVADISLLQQ